MTQTAGPSVPSPETSYDQVPYPRLPFVETHPWRLRTVAKLFGLDAPPAETCRVLELGCATGGNVLPMAYALPGASFVGIDLSARQIESANAAAGALGLRNVRFVTMS